jgi:hypothetical protein
VRKSSMLKTANERRRGVGVSQPTSSSGVASTSSVGSTAVAKDATYPKAKNPTKRRIFIIFK